MGRLKLDFHTVVSDGPVEVRWKHHEKRRDDGQQRDARHRDHKSSQDVLHYPIMAIHPLLHEHIPLEHDERQHRDAHEDHERGDIKQDRDARHNGLLVLVVPYVGVHRSDQCRQHRVHRQADHDHARVAQELAEAAAAEHGKACQETSAAARRRRGAFDNAIAFSRLPELGYNGIDVAVTREVLVRQRQHVLGDVAVRRHRGVSAREKGLEAGVVPKIAHAASSHK